MTHALAIALQLIGGLCVVSFLGLGAAVLVVLVRRPAPIPRKKVERRAHSQTTPLAYLHEDEWQLWTSVIAASAR